MPEPTSRRATALGLKVAAATEFQQTIDSPPSRHRESHTWPTWSQGRIRAARHTLVFARTKRGAERLVQKFGAQNVAAVAVHGDMSQRARERALAQFESGGSMDRAADSETARLPGYAL
ncbi:MAG: hypothetical protein E6G09_12355 [Actinobacteria bacterium]|nr:MAG: hypothetical protein E6G09_12355 [Actinomycetota bacterium]